MAMQVVNYNTLSEFIESTTELTCAYELIALYTAIKIRDTEGKIDRELLAKLFIDFYKIRKENKLKVEKPCNPLESEDLEETLQMLNRGPIGTLLKVGILKTFVRFDTDIYIVIVENEESVLSNIESQILRHYKESDEDPLKDLEKLLNKWKTRIKSRLAIVAKEASQKMPVELGIKAAAPEVTVPESKPASTQYTSKRIHTLTSIYQQMQEEAVEEEKNGKKKKKK